MHYPSFIHLKEVGPRDGLQNESIFIDTEDKVKWIDMLSDSGVGEIEYSSFVHPKWIPALKDAQEVGKKIKRNPNVRYSALVPNLKGLERALEAGIDGASVFMSVSETHNRKNINKSVEETYPILREVISEAKSVDKFVTGYVSTVFDCPYEGRINPEQVIRVCDELFAVGVDFISLGDTIGSAVPSQVEALLEPVLIRYDSDKIIMHFHDTRGMAIANILTSLNYGITRFDSAVGGLGGCPYAKGAAGNVATNDVLYLLHGLGIKTGVQEDKMQQAALCIQDKLGKQLPSKVLAYHYKILVRARSAVRAHRGAGPGKALRRRCDARRGDGGRRGRAAGHHRRPAGHRPGLQDAARSRRRRGVRGADLSGRGSDLLDLSGHGGPGDHGPRRHAHRRARDHAGRPRALRTAPEVHLHRAELPQPGRRDALARAPSRAHPHRHRA